MLSNDYQLFATFAQQVLLALTVLVCGGAIIWGRSTERWASISIVVASVVSTLVQNRTSWTDPQWAVLAIDAANLLFFLALLYRRRRLWLIGACSFQLLMILTHVGMAFDITIMSRAYIATLYIMYAGLLCCLAVGIWEGRRVEPYRNHALR